MATLDFTISSIEELAPEATSGGFKLTARVLVAQVEGYRMTSLVVVAEVSEATPLRVPEDFEIARLNLMRAARDRLRELAVQNQRECD